MREASHLRIVQADERQCAQVRVGYRCDLIAGHEGQHLSWRWADGVKVRRTARVWAELR